MKGLSVHLRWKVGVYDLQEIQEELLALQAGHSIRLQREAEVLSVGSAPKAAPVPSHTVASQVAVATGAAVATAENHA